MTKISQLTALGSALAAGDQFFLRDISDASTPIKSVTADNIVELLLYGGDIGTAPNQIPLNQFLGSMAFQSADAIQVGTIQATGTGGIGYGIGAGSSVTQATSRTTGVTINTICGSITLVSAAGSASYQTFTVTNSTVAANDVVIISQKSGTDKYEAFVTAVGAGSFAITFATTGGTTTEQPVFNFAVIKSSIA